MPPYHLPPGVARMIADVLRRVEALEFKLARSKPRRDVAGGLPLTFSHPGVPAAGTPSPRWYTNDVVSFTQARVSAASAGAGDLDIDVNHNGTLVRTLTLGTGANTAVFAATFSLAPGDWVDVAVAAVDGHQDVSVELYQ